MFSQLTQHIQARHIGLLGLILVAFAYMALFRYDAYGIDEGGAIALLLNWSVTDQIANATPLFGFPDLRAVLFMFLNIGWAGSLPAAKVFTLFMLLASALMMYRWHERYHSGEAAMIATGMLMISPIAVMQADAIAPGIYLLLSFACAYWLDDMYQRSKRALAASFFLLMLICALSVSLHPAGLALPVALAWVWLTQRRDEADKRLKLVIGLALTTTLILVARMGWPNLAETGSYLGVLGSMFAGSPLLLKGEPTGYGLIAADLLGLIVAMYIYRRKLELMSLMLVLAALLGLTHPDYTWSFVSLVCILYIGTPMLIALNRKLGLQNLLGQRGLVLLMVVIMTVMFTSADKHFRIINQLHLKSDTDYLLAAMAEQTRDTDKHFLIASQWPGRTMLATKRDVLPLPPSSRLPEDPQKFIGMMGDTTHLIFDPRNEQNLPLARLSAALGHKLIATNILPGGAIMQFEKEAR